MWKLITEETPPANKVLKTKIDDKDGIRNEQELLLDNNLWWYPDKSMYVYYTPTHWWDCITAKINESGTDKLK